VTLKIPSVSIRQLKLQAACALWFTHKHVVVHTCDISRGVEIRTLSNSENDLQDHSRSLLLVLCGMPHSDFLLVYHFNCKSLSFNCKSVSCTVSEILPLIYQTFKRSNDHEKLHSGGSLSITHTLAVTMVIMRRPTRNEFPSFTGSKDMMEAPKFKNGYLTLTILIWGQFVIRGQHLM